jgi:hypothetical protein
VNNEQLEAISRRAAVDLAAIAKRASEAKARAYYPPNISTHEIKASAADVEALLERCRDLEAGRETTCDGCTCSYCVDVRAKAHRCEAAEVDRDLWKRRAERQGDRLETGWQEFEAMQGRCAKLRQLAAAVEHALELGYLGEGSTAGWVREALECWHKLQQREGG